MKYTITNLKKGDLVTILGISSFMGNTTKTVIQYTGNLTSDGKQIFKEPKKGARKKFTIRPFNDEVMAFVGDVPFKIDSEITTNDGVFSSRIMRGNACFNLVGDSSEIKDWIMNRNINPDFKKYDYVLLVDGDKEIPLFPEVPTSHAVVARVREAMPAATNLNLY